MMQTATYALEGDLYEIIPNIISEIKKIAQRLICLNAVSNTVEQKNASN